MSWLDKIKNDLIITLGDGQRYAPSWMNASFQSEYNISEFEFPNLNGTLVKRGNPLGRKYGLELYFQGADHLDQSLAFAKSANDTRPWTLEHPFYDTLIVQPTSLFFDNTSLNVSKITGIVIETIVDGNPKTTILPTEAIGLKKNNLDASLAGIPLKPNAADVNDLSAKNRRNFKVAIPHIKVPKEFEAYNNAFNVANTAVNNAIASPLLAMRYTIALITKPAQFALGVKSRINLLVEQFDNLRANLTVIGGNSGKTIHEITSGSVVSSMVLTSSLTGEDDTSSAADVLDVMDSIVSTYNTYMEDLDSLQSINGGNPSFFIPDAASMILLNDLVNLAVSSLFDIALNSKQERSLIVEKDTNIILLTHRLYGLDDFDNNMNSLIGENNLGLNGLLVIKKGTKIVYYI